MTTKFSRIFKVFAWPWELCGKALRRKAMSTSGWFLTDASPLATFGFSLFPLSRHEQSGHEFVQKSSFKSDFITEDGCSGTWSLATAIWA